MADPQGRGITSILALHLAVGVVFYHQVEHWSWVNCLYFSVTTLTTLGYGDYAPTTDLSKLFTIAFLITGMGVLAAFVAAFGENALAEHTETRELLQRRKKKSAEGGPAGHDAGE